MARMLFEWAEGNHMGSWRVSLTNPFPQTSGSWIMMRFNSIGLCAALLAFVMAGPLQAQSSTPLGPKDGRDLPATELDRVAIGTIAPDFTLESLDGGRLTLSAFQGEKNVVLVFYRGHW